MKNKELATVIVLAALSVILLVASALESRAENPVVITQGETVLREAPAPAASADSDTVYVSRSGVIHSRPDCSGMKNFTEMPLDEALNQGYHKCQRCW